MHTNPYAAPQAQNDDITVSERNSNLRWVRVLFGFHLFAIVICAVFVMDDTGAIQIQAPANIEWMMLGFIPIAFSYMFFPLAMAIAVSQLAQRSLGFRCSIVAFDVMLSMFQLFVLLPAFQ